MDDMLQFTVNEQNALAMLCEAMAEAAYKIRLPYTRAEDLKLEDKLIEIADRFPSINWGQLYDKFHRQGVNR